MTSDRSAIYRALFLVLGCACYRILGGLYPDLMPNISPMVAVALVGAMYLPSSWGWLVGAAAMLLSDAAFLTVNKQVEGTMFSWWTAAALLIYVGAGLLGVALARNRSLLKIAAGSVCCSVAFYLVANTFAFAGNLAGHAQPAYAPTLAGWWQANTVGLPGWQPTWTFLRNGVLGDLFFCGVLLAILDCGLLWQSGRTRSRVLPV